jgi:hypothetical protein
LAKAPPSTGDFQVSVDGGAFANLGTLPAVTPAGGVAVKITLSQAETNGDNIIVRCVDAAGAEWCDLMLDIQTVTRQLDDLAYPSGSIASVTGAVGSIAAGGITATSFGTSAIDAAALAPDATTEIATGILATALAELTADPGVTPALKDAVMLVYMALRNKRETTATADKIFNSAASNIMTAVVSDDGTTFTKAKYA